LREEGCKFKASIGYMVRFCHEFLLMSNNLYIGVFTVPLLRIAKD
jgi:hypothetical protein